MVLLMFLQEKVSEADGRRKATVPRLPLHIEAMLWNQKQEMEEKAARMLRAAAASSALAARLDADGRDNDARAALADPQRLALAARDGRGRREGSVTRRAAAATAATAASRLGSGQPLQHRPVQASDDWRPARTRTRPRAIEC